MLFSIITPSFNQLDWLRLCIASVRDQVVPLSSAPNQEPSDNISRPATPGPRPSSLTIEHIIQDAGSPGIEEFAIEIGANFYREGKLLFEAPSPRLSTLVPRPYNLTIHVEKDSGMYDAINRGLLRSQGDLCAYLNCDEQYLPGALDRVTREFARHPETDLLFGDVILLDRNAFPISYRQAMKPLRFHLRLCQLPTFTCATFFRRTIIERGFLFDPAWKLIGDAVWVDSMLKAGVTAGMIPSALSLFTWTGDNLSEIERSRGRTSESERWIDQPGSPPRILRRPAALMHRLRKLVAGAYKQRVVDVPRYTPENPETRLPSDPVKLPTGWPGQTLRCASRN